MKKEKEEARFVPKFKGQEANTVVIDPSEPNSWVFWIDDHRFLTVVWDTDNNHSGYFRLLMMNLRKGKPELMEFAPGKKAPAFTGRVVVKGTSSNDLYASYGFDDENIVDTEGNITNKPKEIHIIPHRETKYDRRK